MDATTTKVTWDGNEAAAWVAYRLSEVIAIYPITPASPMGEHADAWSAVGTPNLWGDVPEVAEMQSEGGAAGAVHGAIQAGALTTTFTASQGLLLMIPDMYKMAGELSPVVLHVAARSIATHALSIFGDHSDVMGARQTGFALLSSASVQEAHDLALIAHATALSARVPVLHFMDGFRTSHEVATCEQLSNEDLRALVDDADIQAWRDQALTPDRPVLRGTAQNPDVFFQAREACTPMHAAVPGIVEAKMEALAARTGRTYRLFDYHGHPEAERVVMLMGSGAEAVRETVDWLLARGEKVGMVQVRLYRPFSAAHLLASLPTTTRSLAVLDRTKEPGSPGDPLYLDVLTALWEARQEGRSPFAQDPMVVAGRYGLSSKEFDPAMIVSIYANLSLDRPKQHFTIGIHDDLNQSSLDWDPSLDIEADDVFRAVFYGLGSDGTVGANKNSIKIIAESTGQQAQGYFVYDSKKSGAITVSHLRFGPRPIRAPWLVRGARFVGCHQWSLIDKTDVLERAAPGAVLLLNAPFPADQVWDRLPAEQQAAILEKGARVYTIDAWKVAREEGIAGRINTIMQTCFFAISGVLPKEEAITRIKESIKKTYGKRGEEVVQANYRVVDASVAHLEKVPVPGEVTSSRRRPPVVPAGAPDFVQRVTAMIMAGMGDALPVSAFSADGTWPTGTTRWEKRGIAEQIPAWDPSICIQCNKCAIICPHAAVRVKAFPAEAVEEAPESFLSMPYRGRELPGFRTTIQVAPDDCTGCTLCVAICPARDKKNPRHKALDMVPFVENRDVEAERFAFFEEIPEIDRTRVAKNAKDSQLLQPLFEFSGACAGCGETPYLKLLTQLFGDRMLVANATGCSSIYGGNLPTTPWAQDKAGRGPAWSNSLFEDNAEFGMGMRLAVDRLVARARRLLQGLAPRLSAALVTDLLGAECREEAEIAAQRGRIEELRAALAHVALPEAIELGRLADYLVRKSLWIVGGDGWAYDIGYGGLDHALASGRDLNIIVLDTQVYSNTGGQASKATPLGAVAKFAANGKGTPRKDLGMLAMAYGHVYVAQIAIGAKDAQTTKALIEAERWPGPSLVIAYSHCIAHGYDMARALDQQKAAVGSGFWPLYRHDPRRAAEGKPALVMDSPPPKSPLADFVAGEARFRILARSNPERARALLAESEADLARRYKAFAELAGSGTPTTE